MRPLASFTTLGLGGPAARFVEVNTRDELRAALAEEGSIRILGGGSNLVVADEGVPGTVVRIATRGIARDGSALTVEAGEPWESVVARALQYGLAGVECLTGIPGSTGATPIQNVGAYGQEVADVIEAVEVLERATGSVRWLDNAACGFGYRDSRFKRQPERFVVLSVRFLLRADGVPQVRYRELADALSAEPTLAEVRAAVRTLRAAKGMLIDDSFEPSAGSFFTNPVVSAAQLEDVLARVAALGFDSVPRFDVADGYKLAAGWLIERAGIQKGLRRGGAGVSRRHALALVNHGGTTRELLALADEIRDRVQDVFGVRLEIEPVRWP